MITEDQVIEAQNQWGAGVVKIGSFTNSRKKLEIFVATYLVLHYCLKKSTVLFTPTKCAQEQFRPTKAEATSYFIAGEGRSCEEDKGFAINPWTKVRFENTGFILEEKRALAMGNYYFTDLEGNEAKVEYTFGYQLIDGTLKIDLHHSSFPYNP